MNSYSDTRCIRQLIYGGEILSEEDYDSMLEKIDNSQRDMQHGCRRPSLYLELFEDMINTVYEHEPHLFSQSEWDIFAALRSYCYNARYCLVRLVLRKPEQWHTLSSLAGYKKEVGEVGLIRAITDLCRPLYEVTSGTEEGMDMESTPSLQSEERETTDLTTSIRQNRNEEPGPSGTSTSSRSSSTLPGNDFLVLSQSFQENLQDVGFDSFCYDESIMDITELLNRLSVKQLKELVKATKIRPTKSTKLEMIRALLANAAVQSVLDFPASPVNEELRRVPEPRLCQTTLSFEVKTSVKGKEKVMLRNQEQRLVQMVLKILGKCVRINGDFYRLVQRLHLIYFRCTEQPTSLLLPALLASFRKRAYPQYKYERDKSIWPTREDLLEYEGALELETHLEEVMTKSQKEEREPKTLVLPGSSVTPVVPVGQILRTPRTLLKTPKDPPVLGSVVKEETEELSEDALLLPALMDEEDEEANVRKARRVKELLYERIYSKWTRLIETKTREGQSRKPGLERFEPGMRPHSPRNFQYTCFELQATFIRECSTVHRAPLLR
ncbi:hypothetical protein AX15_006413 [Amanita polypyramis BW_CC]|nr:hypothetical protein AX15_006413 [Amanita polypyramis BW_CC]